MLDFLPAPLKGTLAALLILCNTLVLIPFLLAVALLKLVLPITAVRKGCTVILNTIADMYGAKIVSDQTADRAGQVREPFMSFMWTWLMNK